MSHAELRSLLLGASLGQGPVPDFARMALATWGRDMPAAPSARPPPLTNREKCARRRMRSKGVEPPSDDTARDTAATPNDTAATPDTVSNGVAPSRALPLSSPLLSSPSSSGSPAPSEPLFPVGSSGSTGAREPAGKGGPEGLPGERGGASSGGPDDTAATPRDTKRHRRDTNSGAAQNAGRPAPIPAAWRPAPETLSWAAQQGVDVEAIVPEFVEYWRDRAVNNPRDAKARRTAWELTFKKRVREMMARDEAPMLPATFASQESFTGEIAPSVAAVLSGNAMPAPLFGKDVS